MTPEEFKAARRKLGLTQRGLAAALRMAEKGGPRSIRTWETPGNTVPGPAQVAVELLLRDACRTGEIPTE